MSNNPNSNTITVSFCNQPYPAYLGGYNLDITERTAMALENLAQLKRNVSNHQKNHINHFRKSYKYSTYYWVQYSTL